MSPLPIPVPNRLSRFRMEILLIETHVSPGEIHALGGRADLRLFPTLRRFDQEPSGHPVSRAPVAAHRWQAAGRPSGDKPNCLGSHYIMRSSITSPRSVRTCLSGVCRSEPSFVPFSACEPPTSGPLHGIARPTLSSPPHSLGTMPAGFLDTRSRGGQRKAPVCCLGCELEWPLSHCVL
jgi:hypothetical protein